MNYMDDDYQTSAQAYLARCREQLVSGTKRGLFYAAFELRCCVESRLAQYFEHYKPLSLTNDKFKPYLLAKNQDKVNTLMAGDKITQVTFKFEGEASINQYYTPVPLRLQNYVLKSNDALRHAQKCYRSSDDPWWNETRSRLNDAYREAWLTCRGEMPLPVMLDAGSNRVQTVRPPWEDGSTRTTNFIIYQTDENKVLYEQLRRPTNKQMSIDVRYLDKPPSDWVIDL